MDIDLPRGWSERGGGVEHSYYLAENENGVAVGYSLLRPNSYSVWAGKNWTDNKTLDASCDSETEAKLQALEFMKQYPDARYEESSGIGYLKDSDDHHISI